MAYLPNEAIDLHGGCHCRAIRYKMSIPALPERPVFATAHESAGKGGITAPIHCIDHCDDCRRATGSLVNFWMLCPRDMITISCLMRTPLNERVNGIVPKTQSKTRSQSQGSEADVDDREDRITFTAHDVCHLKNDSDFQNTFLAYYNSSPAVRRVFCQRCGSHLAYGVHPWPGPPGMPQTMDWLLGTLDREELVREAVRVERHLWWDCGIEWVRRLLSEGDTTIVDDGKGGRLPRHPLWDVRILKEIAETSVAEYEGFDGDREGRDGNA